MDERQFVFAPFHLDPVSQQLWRGTELVPLRPKLFAVLRHLLEHAGRLVTQHELRAAVWPATAISDSVLRGAICDLRDALGDDANAAHFIETLPHRGHRFIAAVTRLPRACADPRAGRPPFHGVPFPTNGMLIGRDAELARLR